MTKTFTLTRFETPLGTMLAIADTKAVYVLTFGDSFTEHDKAIFEQQTGASIIEDTSKIIDKLKEEVCLYFAGKLTHFTTPFCFVGTAFQQEVWHTLLTIPHGSTKTYKDIAEILGKPKAYRAVGTAIGMNKHLVMIPCHRVINRDGKLGGYHGGVSRKEWLLKHEKAMR